MQCNLKQGFDILYNVKYAILQSFTAHVQGTYRYGSHSIREMGNSFMIALNRHLQSNKSFSIN